jgi:hypothetical protein
MQEKRRIRIRLTFRITLVIVRFVLAGIRLVSVVVALVRLRGQWQYKILYIGRGSGSEGSFLNGFSRPRKKLAPRREIGA